MKKVKFTLLDPPDNHRRARCLDSKFSPKGSGHTLRRQLADEPLKFEAERFFEIVPAIERIAARFNARSALASGATGAVTRKNLAAELGRLSAAVAAAAGAIDALGEASLALLHSGWWLDRYHVERKELRGRTATLGLPDFQGFEYPAWEDGKSVSHLPGERQFYLAPRLRALAFVAEAMGEIFEQWQGQQRGGHQKNLHDQKFGSAKWHLARECAELAQYCGVKISGTAGGLYFRLVAAVYEYATGDGPEETNAGLSNYVKDLAFSWRVTQKALAEIAQLQNEVGARPQDRELRRRLEEAHERFQMSRAAVMSGRRPTPHQSPEIEPSAGRQPA